MFILNCNKNCPHLAPHALACSTITFALYYFCINNLDCRYYTLLCNMLHKCQCWWFDLTLLCLQTWTSVTRTRESAWMDAARTRLARTAACVSPGSRCLQTVRSAWTLTSAVSLVLVPAASASTWTARTAASVTPATNWLLTIAAVSVSLYVYNVLWTELSHPMLCNHKAKTIFTTTREQKSSTYNT